MSYVHIYAPQVTDRAIVAATCPDCGRRTRMIGFFQDWHGWASTCLRCGRHWDDGEWIPLEFHRNARTDSIKRAKDRWRRLSNKASATNE